MEQNILWKNITGTACVLGVALTSIGINSTQIVGSINDKTFADYSMVREQTNNSIENFIYTEPSNLYIDRNDNQLESEAEELFGKMREATVEESESVNNYVRSISKDIGANFFDLC